MPRPLKDPAVRQRRNKAPSRATLAPVEAATRPELPDRADGVEWHPLAREWWDAVWSSPMAAQYVDGDVPDLVMLAELRHRFWLKPSVGLAAELRQHGARFGLSPLDRRRLEWQITRIDAAKDAPKRPAKPAAAKDDPRRLLAAVK